MPIPNSTNPKQSIKKDIYESYSRSGNFGDGSRFFSATIALLKRIQETREENAFRKLLSETIGFTIQLRQLPEYLKNFSYEVTYDTLEIIDDFLTHTGAMHTLIESHNKKDPAFPEIGGRKLFDMSPASPQDVIGLQRRFPSCEINSDSLDHILLLGNTIFYANKAAKFIDAVEHRVHKKFHVSDNPYVSTQIIDKFCRSSEVSQYISLYSAKTREPEKMDEAVENIIVAINTRKS